MPPSAASKRPIRSRRAPVKLPRTWPKNSLSKSVSGIAPQFTLTIGLPLRPLHCVDRACDKFLAGSGLALDEHRRVRRSNE